MYLVEYCLFKNSCPLSSVQSLSHVWLFATHENQHASPPCPSPPPGVHPNPCPLMPSSHLILCRPLLLLPSNFPSIRVFQMGQLFASGGQSIGISTSTSVLPMNTQDWSLLGWAGWISLQSKGLSRVYPNTTVQNHSFSSPVFFIVQLSHPYMTSGKP